MQRRHSSPVLQVGKTAMEPHQNGCPTGRSASTICTVGRALRGRICVMCVTGECRAPAMPRGSFGVRRGARGVEGGDELADVAPAGLAMPYRPCPPHQRVADQW
jgi:hypothetical protein